jgi:hypothetical protein
MTHDLAAEAVAEYDRMMQERKDADMAEARRRVSARRRANAQREMDSHAMKWRDCDGR